MLHSRVSNSDTTSLWISCEATSGRLDRGCAKRDGRLAAQKPENATGALRRPSETCYCNLRLLVGNDDHLHCTVDVGVQMHVDIELTGVAQRAFAHDHFALFQRMTGGAERLGDIARTN